MAGKYCRACVLYGLLFVGIGLMLLSSGVQAGGGFFLGGGLAFWIIRAWLGYKPELGY